MDRSFLKALNEGIMVADGAMGTMLYARGILFNRCFDELNLSQPEVVRAVHREYVEAGAELVETNTFGANRFKLEAHGLAARVREVNLAGARLAREEVGEEGWVGGSVGPVTRVLAPIGKVRAEEARDAFREQAAALAEGGVDLLVLETMPDVAQMEEAVRGVGEACDLPLLALMTFSDEGKTLGGEEPGEVAGRLASLGVEMLGANCSVGPAPMLDVIRGLAGAGPGILAAMPNAGFPRLVEGRYLYLTSPEYLAEYARLFVEAGVSLVGGCCGTTPEHIRAVAQAVKALQPRRREAPAVSTVTRPASMPAAAGAISRGRAKVPRERKTSLGAQLGSRFLVSVEIDPPRGVDPQQIIGAARRLREGGVDFINIADGPRASARMSPLALAFLIQQQVGLEVILHYTCRDRNLLGMQADLLGAHALGVKNLLAVTGDPPKMGDYPHATGVFDVDSIGLVGIISCLNDGVDLAGKEIGEPTSFLVGVGANPGAPDLDGELARLEQKTAAGAEFCLTQPVYEPGVLEEFLRRTGPWELPVMVGILPLRSYRHAEFLHNEVPGMAVPRGIRDRMRGAGDRMAEEGMAIAREALRGARDLAAGAYLMPPFGRYEVALDVLAGL